MFLRNGAAVPVVGKPEVVVPVAPILVAAREGLDREPLAQDIAVRPVLSIILVFAAARTAQVFVTTPIPDVAPGSASILASTPDSDMASALRRRIATIHQAFTAVRRLITIPPFNPHRPS